MAVIRGNGSEPKKRQPSLRGAVMADVSGGVIRARGWPSPRGAPKTIKQKRAQDKFAAANEATKYLAPQIMADFTAAVKGTPLLPRDLLIQIMFDRLAAFEMINGRTLWPMTARNDVSQALDTLSQTPGDVLVRGDEWWEARTIGPGTIAPWQLISDTTLSSPVGSFEAKNLDGLTDVQALIVNGTKSVSGYFVVQVSTDNGASYFTSSANYTFIPATGAPAAAIGAGMHTTNATAARTGLLQINKTGAGIFPILWSQNAGVAYIFTGSTDEVNAIRIIPSNGGNINTGRIVINAR